MTKIVLLQELIILETKLCVLGHFSVGQFSVNERLYICDLCTVVFQSLYLFIHVDFDVMAYVLLHRGMEVVG
jgi:hypothetical protein